MMILRTSCSLLFLGLLHVSHVNALPSLRGLFRRLVMEDNQEPCDWWGCWSGRAYIKPLWMEHSAIYWRCHEPGMIALTFDDAFDVNVTEKILDELDLYQIKATFFVEGYRIDETTKDLLIRADAEGHTVASHTFKGPSMEGICYDRVDHFLANEVIKNELEVEKYIPKMKHYIRPPYLEIDKRMATEVEALGYKVVMTNLDSQDWRLKNMSLLVESFTLAIEDEAASETVAGKNSFISLQHATLEHTVPLIKEVYLRYRDDFRFVNMEACLGDIPEDGEEVIETPNSQRGRYDQLLEMVGSGALSLSVSGTLYWITPLATIVGFFVM